MKATGPLLPVLILVLVTGCTERSSDSHAREAERQPATSTISGVVNYRERVALTNRAVLALILEDVSRQDVAATVIAEKTIRDPGQVPIRFALEYPVDAIDPRRAYALRARITDRGRLLFTTDTVLPVLTRGAGKTVNPMLVQVAVADAAAPAAAETPF